MPRSVYTAPPGSGSGGSMTAAQILAALLTVDGTGSGLDADLVDGNHASALLARANHTGTQTASTVSDFSEAVDDRVAVLLTAGTNITLTYNDGANTLTVDAAGGGATPFATIIAYGG